MSKFLHPTQSRAFMSPWLITAILACCAPTVTVVSHAKNLTVAMSVGSYADTMDKVFVTPFKNKTGVGVHVTQDPQILHVLRSGRIAGDIVSLTERQATQGCAENLLIPIEPDKWLPGPHGESPSKDFHARALTKCAVAILAYAMPYVFDADKFSKRKPETIADFFDLETFPGKRGLGRLSRDVNLRWALLADGVRPTDVEDVLTTKRGLDRAFQKLEGIKKHVIWWDKKHPAPKLMLTRQVLMTSIWSTRIRALANEMAAVGQVWDKHVRKYYFIAIPRGGRMQSEAVDFMKFITSTETQTRLGLKSLYGPVRRSASERLVSALQCTNGTCPCQGSNVCSKSCCGSGFGIDPSTLLSRREQVRERFERLGAK